MNATSYTASGTKSTSQTSLNPKVFSVEIKSNDLLKEAYNAYLANGRANLAVTKTRGLVRGGGRKPWRQKGTGRARFGSTRNPIWRGGGIVFGPTGQENYRLNLNKKARQLALKQALSLAANSKKIIVIEDFKLKNAKTAELNKLLTKLGLSRRIGLVIDAPSDELAIASRNLPDVYVITSPNLAVNDVLDSDSLVITKAALTKLDERLGGK